MDHDDDPSMLFYFVGMGRW